ncbi:MAG: hypothetical protein M1834_002116 [Cirrosporium novae-zelandiae]|nr:MAG: hypothetical protein M1834_002116 [Cirrosporium novae-zelandiae]
MESAPSHSTWSRKPSHIILKKDIPSSTSILLRPQPRSAEDDDLSNFRPRSFFSFSRLFSEVAQWKFELLASVSSLCFLTAIIINLQKFDGRPQSSWPYEYTLNCFIALLATIGRVSLMVSIASIIGQGKCYLSTIAALVAVLVLGLDTFVQQVLQVTYNEVVTLAGPSGNLTITRCDRYADYVSSGGLGLCGECSNVTSRMTKLEDGALATYTLPNGLSYTNVTSLRTYLYGSINISVTTQDNAFHYSDQDTYYFTIFDIIKQPYGEKTPSATECALWFCVQALDISSKSGLQQQHTVETWSKYKNISLDPFPLNFTFASLPTRMNAPENTTFSIDAVAFDALQQEVSSWFSQAEVWGSGALSDQVRILWDRDASFVIPNMATSMTNIVRKTPYEIPPVGYNNSAYQNQYYGTGYQSEPFIKVRWPWLVYPATLTLISFPTLVATIFQSAASDVPSWRNSPLALLCCPLETNTRQRIAEQDQLDSIVRKAEDVSVRLAVDQDGWRFNGGGGDDDIPLQEFRPQSLSPSFQDEEAIGLERSGYSFLSGT